MIESLQPIEVEGIAPPLGQYAHAVVDRPTGFVFVAGQVAIDPAGELVGEGDPAAQTKRVLENVEAVLAAAGSGLDRVVKLMTYVVGAEAVTGFRRARAEFFAERFGSGPYPAHTLVVVAGLSDPSHLVEIEAVATRCGEGASA
jgi:2-iminobutanoate/2-iminopropanoate deaminase